MESTGMDSSNQQMWRAIANQDVDAAVDLIESGADVNSPLIDEDGYSRSLLSFAITTLRSPNDRLRIVQHFLSAGAHVDSIDRPDTQQTSTPLIDACGKGDEVVVRLLLEHGAVINDMVACNNRTPLVCAASNNHWKLIEVLVSNGAVVNGVAGSCLSPLYAASALGNVESVRALLDQGANPNQLGQGETPLCIASRNGLTEIVRLLVSRGANVNYNCGLFGTPVVCAAFSGHYDALKLLIENGARVNVQGREEQLLMFALHRVVAGGHENVLRLLLDNQLSLSVVQRLSLANVAIASKQPRILLTLMSSVPRELVRALLPPLSAISNDDAETMLTLFELGLDVVIPDLSNKLCNAIFTAASTGKSQIVRLFIDKGFDVNVRDINGKTLLIAAAASGSLETVKDLVERGADVYAVDGEGRSALDHVLFGRHWEAVRYLSQCWKQNTSTVCHSEIERHDCNTALHGVTRAEEAIGLLNNGADVNAENIFGLRPLHYAAKQGLGDLAELLIIYGAVIDAKDFAGNTALHLAATRGLAVVKALTKHLTSPSHLNIRNASGRTALHEAVQHGNYNAVLHLLERGADADLVDIWLNTAFHYAGLQSMVLWSNIRSYLPPNRMSAWTKPNLFGISIIDRLEQNVVSIFCHCNKTLIYSRDKIKKYKSDIFGNTELHNAFGVYTASKVFLPSVDPAATCSFLKNSDKVQVKSQNVYGQTPIHVARNASEVLACLQYVNDDILLTTDKRKRNFWHLLAFREYDPRHIVESIEQQTTDGKFRGLDAVDVFGRTPLHYAVANPKVEWYAKWLTQKAIHCASMHDMYGRPPLHYVTFGSPLDSYIRQILEAPQSGSGVQLCDDALVLAMANRDNLGSSYFDSRVNEFRRSESSHGQEKLFMESTGVVRFQFNSIVDRISKSQTELILLRNCECEGEFVWKIWQSHQFTYTNYAVDLAFLRHAFEEPQERRSETKAKSCSFATAEHFEKSATVTNTDQSSTTDERLMFDFITELVTSTICRMAKRVGETDPNFRCHVEPAGSSYEVTKVDFCDEFDFIVVLENFSDVCTVVDSLYSPEGFVMLKGVTGKTAMCEEFFDNDGILNTSQVKFRFEALVKQVMYEPSFQLENDALELVEVLRGENILYSFSLKRPGINIEMKFMRPVNNQFLFHEVSIDIVPAIRIPNYWPTDAVQDLSIVFGPYCDRLPDRRCYLVFDQPQRHRPWIPWTPSHARADFSLFESDVIRSSPPVVRAACIVVKQIVRNFCDFRFFKSYAIKAALMHCIADYADELSKIYRSSSTDVDKDLLLQWVQRILLRMLCYILQDFVPSVLLHGFKLPTCSFQTYLKFSHIHLFKHGLTHLDLVKVDLLEREKTKKMIDSQFEYLVKSYIISHLMYWSVLPNNAARHVCNLPIDPLCETDYWTFMQSL